MRSLDNNKLTIEEEALKSKRHLVFQTKKIQKKHTKKTDCVSFRKVTHHMREKEKLSWGQIKSIPCFTIKKNKKNVIVGSVCMNVFFHRIRQINVNTYFSNTLHNLGFLRTLTRLKESAYPLIKWFLWFMVNKGIR